MLVLYNWCSSTEELFSQYRVIVDGK